jgi:preprotein translocase SecF subunit
MVLGIVMLFVNGLQLDIQFKGGAIIKYSFENELDLDRVDEIVTQTLNRGVDIQETESNANAAGGAAVKRVVLNLAGNEGLSEEAQIQLDAALKAEFPEANLVSAGTSVVKPFIGERFLARSIRALILATIFILLYIWYSFRKVSGLSAGVMAFVALIHDVFVAFFIFVIFKIPLNESFIAVALTILGFSINDTIVIYDRIRENKRLYGTKMPIDELVDKSITQSITRSVNTNVATFISIFIVYIFALIYDIESIKTFALPMAFGTVSGCYSTICIAGPLWVTWQKFKTRGKTKTA